MKDKDALTTIKSIKSWRFWVALAYFPSLVFGVSVDDNDFSGPSGNDEFSNNLFSDLAPLLALFGERVATQYLRHSTRKLEGLIFACAPLGILTAVTSAIRVGGTRKLRAIIGRAEESEAEAEIELLSSTSLDVCELWNGVGVVRVVGKADILEFIYDEVLAAEGNPDYAYGIYTRRSKQTQSVALQVNGSKTGSTARVHGDGDEEAYDFYNSPSPNIALNTTTRTINTREMYATALIGVVLQSTVLVFDAVVIYYLKWTKAGNPVQTYAFPFAFIGTLGIVIGTYLCAHIIESSTRETAWKPVNSKGTPGVIWIQRGQKVNDQSFGSYAIYAPASVSRGYLMKSHKIPDQARFHRLAEVASVLTIIAFILQFVGLRGMHFSATIAQGVATVIMFLLRVSIRRHISQRPINLDAKIQELPSHATYSVQPLEEGFELDIMAMQLQKCSNWQVQTHIAAHALGKDMVSDQRDDESIESKAPSQSIGDHVIRTRERLAQLLPPQSPWNTEFYEHAQWLSQTIGDLASMVWSMHAARRDIRLTPEAHELTYTTFPWRVPIKVQSHAQSDATMPQYVHLTLTRSKEDQWQLEGGALIMEALLSLWMYNLKIDPRAPRLGYVLWLLCPEQDKMCPILGDWWIRREDGTTMVRNKSLMEICSEHGIIALQGEHGTKIPNYNRIVGDSIDDINAIIPRAILKRMTQINMAAQFLLYTFISQLTKTCIDSITAPTSVGTIHEGAIDDVIGTPYLFNDCIRDLAHEVRKGGPLVTKADSYRIVTCALHAGGKLLLPMHILEQVLAYAKDPKRNPDAPIGTQDKGLSELYKLLYEHHSSQVEGFIARERWREAGELIQRTTDMFEGHLEPNSSWGRDIMKQMGEKIVREASQVDPRQFDDIQAEGLPGERCLSDTVRCGGTISEIFRLLLQEHRNIDLPDGSGTTAIEYASASGNPFLVRLLLLFGANIEPLKMTSRPAPLWWAVQEGVKAAPDRRTGFAEIISLLVIGETTPNLRYPTNPSLSPWHFAALQGSAYILEAILSSIPEEGDLRSITEDTDHVYSEYTALHIAAIHGMVDVLEVLLDKGANIEASSNNQSKPIHLAARFGRVDALKTLLDRGANIEAKTDICFTALHDAADNGDLDVIRTLLDRGANIEARSNILSTPLHCAIYHGHLDAINLLLDRGANLEAKTDILATPIHWAAKEGHLDVMKVLLSKGAQIEAKSHNNGTPLHWAAEEAPVSAMELLLDHGAYIEARDDDGYTPLHRAVNKADTEGVTFLLARGADIDARDKRGKTAIAMAKKKNNIEVIRLLQEAERSK